MDYTGRVTGMVESVVGPTGGLGVRFSIVGSETGTMFVSWVMSENQAKSLAEQLNEAIAMRDATE